MNFSYSEEKHPQAGFEPGTPTTNPEHTHALDHSAMAPLFLCVNSINDMVIEPFSLNKGFFRSGSQLDSS